tara:strand:- start:11113 stop:11550 length:438 start_codon:yes stop_codon:yes gene_type:complete
MTRLISIDPGRSKCGLLLADKELGLVLEGKVVDKNSVVKLINQWIEISFIDLIVMGNGTSSSFWKSKMEQEIAIPIHLIDEKDTTLRARKRYWELWPKKFFLRLLPAGLIIPSENLDAIAALVILEDYLGMKLRWPKKDSFKTWL